MEVDLTRIPKGKTFGSVLYGETFTSGDRILIKCKSHTPDEQDFAVNLSDGQAIIFQFGESVTVVKTIVRLKGMEEFATITNEQFIFLREWEKSVKRGMERNT